MFEDFLQRAYDFVAISLFFPFILIFVLAGLTHFSKKFTTSI